MTPEQIKKIFDDIEELKRKIAELEEWKKARMEQQITQPIDLTSQAIIKKTFGI